MRLLRLKVHQLRNLEGVDLRPSPGLTLLEGPNGSGKSSLLESIQLLSQGRSFRTTHLSQLVRHGSDRLVVSADVEDPASGILSMGIEFESDPGRLRMRAGGRPLQRTSELAALLPLVTIHQESHRVVTEGPQLRRQFVDWGLFHVEPSFLALWQRYRRALKQRNAALQRSPRAAEAWDSELVSGAEEMDRLRRRYLEDFSPRFSGFARLLDLPDAIELRYRPGWEASRDYGVALRESLAGDRAIGYTRLGPHRADVALTVGGSRVSEVLSRGQIKVLVFALYLAQVETFFSRTGRLPVVLIDDLTAELDQVHRSRVIQRIVDMAVQCLITSSEPEASVWLGGAPHKVFHVKRGRVEEMI